MYARDRDDLRGPRRRADAKMRLTARSSMGLLVFAAAAMAARGVDVAAPGTPLGVAVGSDGTYNVSVDGKVWLQGEDIWVTSAGRMFSLAAKTLTLVKPPVQSTGRDGLGFYTQTSLLLHARTAPAPTTVEFSIKQWADGETLEFVQQFPTGLPDSLASSQFSPEPARTPCTATPQPCPKTRGHFYCNSSTAPGQCDKVPPQSCPPCPPPPAKSRGDPNAVSTSFPAWRPTAIPGTPRRGWMAYDGWDCDGKHGTCLVQNKANSDPSSAHVSFGRWEMDGSGGGACRARLIKKLSDHGQCVEGKTFGCANGTLWLTDCRGVFQCDPGTLVTCSTNVPVVNGTRRCNCAGNKALPGGLEGSGPMAIFTHDLNRTLVVSAFRNTMAQSQHFANGTLHYGLLGSVTNVPKGWSSSVILSLGRGPTQAVRGWGKKLTSFYGKDDSLSRADFISTHLGFDTDNGAFYYYHPEQGKSYEDTLLDVYDYSQQVGLPYRHVQIDSWWYVKGKDSGTKTWSPANNTFPGPGSSGLQRLHNLTGWVYTAHNRMWSGEVTYAKANGGEFDFIVPVPGGTQQALPLTADFWLWLIGESVQWGLQMYEQDWLYSEFTGVNGTLLRSATLGRQWLMQMDRGVHEHNLGLQLCMAWPRHVLQSLEMPSVTQGRASSDYSLKSEQWRIGDGALFLDAIALRPTKDCFRSNQTSGEAFPRLQAAVSSLSGGPVFPCDELGTSDVDLIMRSCNRDGELLQPTRSATPIDANILWKTGIVLGSADIARGEIWRADTWIDVAGNSALHFPQILAAASGPYALNIAELLDDGEIAPADGFVAVEANSSQPGNIAVAVNASAPLELPRTDKSSFNVWSLAPRLPSGWALLGECSTKWVPVSSQRFSDVVDDSVNGLSVKVRGPPSEIVQVSAVAPDSLTIENVACTIPQGGVSIAKFNKVGSKCVAA